MDILSLGKASKALKQIKNLDEEIVGKKAESHFITVDERLDWIEAQAGKLHADRTLQVDLSKGMFTNTELADGKIQLKVIAKHLDKGTTNMAQGATVISVKGMYTTQGVSSPGNLFDGDTNTYAYSKENISEVIFKLSHKIKPYQFQVTQDSRTGIVSTSISIFAYNEDTGIWDTLTTNKNFVGYQMNTLALDVVTENVYDQFKYESNGSSSTGSPTQVRLNEIKVFAIEDVSEYMASGSYESPVIDLGEGWQDTKIIDVVKQINTGTTDCITDISTSTDGINFTLYETLASQQARYVKIRTTLSATPLPVEVNTYEFNQPVENKVALNDYVLADGDLRLKTEYSYTTEEVSIEAEGKIIKTTIPASLFNKINSLEVM